MTLQRRQFVQSLSLGAATVGSAAAGAVSPAETRAGVWPTLLAPRLRPGDTLGLVSPANATYEREPMQIAIEALQALGFKVKVGAHARARYGHFAGTDAQRAADINNFFADDGVSGLMAVTGGSGCNRIVESWTMH